MSQVRLGVFGSAFDPPTLGHLDVLQQAAGCHQRILLVPSVFHAFDKKPLPFERRLQMLQCFINDAKIACPLEICTLENELLARNPGRPVYTYDLMTALTKQYQGEISFIRGPDNAQPEVWQRFYRWQDIEAQWPIFTAQQRVDVRSSDVRRILATTGQADNDLQEGLLLPSVRTFILTHDLYRTGNS